MSLKRYDMPIPVGDRILVEVEIDETKKLTSDILVIPKDYERNVLASTKIGKVIDIGPDAFIHIHAKEPYCQPGDYISFIQNAGGDLYRMPDSDKAYRLIRPGDVECRIGIEETIDE